MSVSVPTPLASWLTKHGVLRASNQHPIPGQPRFRLLDAAAWRRLANGRGVANLLEALETDGMYDGLSKGLDLRVENSARARHYNWSIVWPLLETHGHGGMTSSQQEKIIAGDIQALVQLLTSLYTANTGKVIKGNALRTEAWFSKASSLDTKDSTDGPTVASDNSSKAASQSLLDKVEERLHEAGATADAPARVSLIWSAEVDCDLILRMPDSQRVDYRNRHGAGGAIALDTDERGRPGRINVENIAFLDTSAAPVGTYRASVSCAGAGSNKVVTWTAVLKVPSGYHTVRGAGDEEDLFSLTVGIDGDVFIDVDDEAANVLARQRAEEKREAIVAANLALPAEKLLLANKEAGAYLKLEQQEPADVQQQH